MANPKPGPNWLNIIFFNTSKVQALFKTIFRNVQIPFCQKYLYVVIWTKYVAWCYFGSQYTKIALKAFCFQRSLCGEIWCSAPVDPLITEREILLPRGRVSYYGPVYCHLLCWSCAGLPHGSLPLQLRTSPCCAPCGGKLGTLSPGGHKALTILSFWSRDERERLSVSREREGKLKITFPFYEKGTGIRKCYGKGNLSLVIPGIPGII